MKLAPLAVFCAMSATIATNGLGILLNYAKFMGEFYFGLVCLWLHPDRSSASSSSARG